MRSVTLLCSAAATGLSHASRMLAGRDGLVVADLEEVLKAEVFPWHDEPALGRTMAAVCASSDRDTVLAYWEEAFDRSVDKLLHGDDQGVAVLSCHLTLFSPTRLEFYSPPLLARLLGRQDIRVDRVVVLIDDIYDMLRRLSEKSALFDSERANGEHRVHSTKLTDSAEESETVDPFSQGDLGTLAIEATVKNLLRLLHWRRSEMLSAEELARNLGVPLTVFAVKHEIASLLTLLRAGRALPIYLSHKITEPRVMNIASARTDGAGRWDDLTRQVNEVARVMLDQEVVVIQPTAIDELRFEKNWQHSDRLERYSGRLADRWPVPPNALYAPPGPEAPRYEHILDGARSDHDKYRHGLFGLLQHSIYDEIAFRDHLLVSCNRGLLIFRPLAINSRISGGVEAEVAHWSLSLRSGRSAPRVAAFVHERDELTRHVTGLPLRQRKRTLETFFERSFGNRVRMAVVEDLWQSCVEDAEPLAAFEVRISSHLERSQSLQTMFEDALAAAVFGVVAVACRVDADAVSWTAHFVGATVNDCTSEQLMERVARVLRSCDERELRDAHAHLLADLRNALGLTTNLALVRHLAELEGLPAPVA